jgi:hypothetical protein
MKDVAAHLSLPKNKLARAFLALCAATILVGLPVPDASARVAWIRFDATWQEDGTILVEWETSAEFDSIAYFLYRAESPNGPWDDYIDFEPAAGDESTAASYSFTDEEVSRNVTYYYRLEEIDSRNASEFNGPIVPNTGSINPATNTPTTTSLASPGQPDVPPTATRQYADTPAPGATSPSSVAATETQPPALTAPPVQASFTRSLTPLVTTPTPVGGIAPTVEAPTPTPEVTGTSEVGPLQPTAGVTDTAISAQPSPPETPIPPPTVQQLAAARKETSQPLLDVSATRRAPAPAQHGAPNPQSGLLVGGGVLVAAAVVGAALLLIWRRRAR